MVVVREVAAPPAARHTTGAAPAVRLRKEEFDWVAETFHLKFSPAPKGAPMLAHAARACLIFRAADRYTLRLFARISSPSAINSLRISKNSSSCFSAVLKFFLRVLPSRG